MRGRERWIPPRPIMEYVCSTLQQTFGFDISQFNPLWIPVCITAAVDWVRVTGWWPYYYTGSFHSGEEYKTVWKHVSGNAGMEMDPTLFKIFRYDESASMFEIRRTHPGLSNMEKTEVVSFVRDVYCPQLNVPKPPIEAVERAVWATLMWMCDSYGKDWLYEVSHLISSTHDFGLGFIHLFNVDSPPSPDKAVPGIDIRDNKTEWARNTVQYVKNALEFLNYQVGVTWELHTPELFESYQKFLMDEGITDSPLITEEVLMALKLAVDGSDLLDPLKMTCTERPVGSCSNCGQNLWCVSQYQITMRDNIASAKGANFLCSACTEGLGMDCYIHDISGEGMKDKCQSCMNQQCPHLKVETDQYGVSIPRLIIETGSKQLEAYRQYLLSQPTGRIQGITAQDLASYYAGNRLGQNDQLGE